MLLQKEHTGREAKVRAMEGAALSGGRLTYRSIRVNNTHSRTHTLPNAHASEEFMPAPCMTPSSGAQNNHPRGWVACHGRNGAREG
jgi:hypothetical protein